MRCLFQVVGVLLYFIQITRASKLPPRLVKPGCRPSCGKVNIPYPFGIGPNCYHNPWFEVECAKTPPYKLSLKGLRNSTISLKTNKPISVVQINWEPVKGVHTLVLETFKHVACGVDVRYTTGYSQNLTGSPYLFSKDHNVLHVFGCGGGVLLKDKNDKTVAGCATICTNNAFPVSGINCYGEGCCQMTIPYSLEYYRYEFVTMHTVRVRYSDIDYTPCAFGVLKDINENKDSVSVVLEWSIKDLPINSPSYANSSCVNKTESVYNAGSLVCRCKHDYFEGNPYLPYGCQGNQSYSASPQLLLRQGSFFFGIILTLFL